MPKKIASKTTKQIKVTAPRSYAKKVDVKFEKTNHDAKLREHDMRLECIEKRVAYDANDIDALFIEKERLNRQVKTLGWTCLIMLIMILMTAVFLKER